MLTFYGYELELVVDAVLQRDDHSLLCAASDADGARWLIFEQDHLNGDLTCLCARVSARALHEVAVGRASAGDAIRHSATGTVEVVTVPGGQAFPDRCVLCAAIPEEWLPARTRITASAA